MDAKWTHDANSIQQAARSIVLHYEDGGWKPPLDDFYSRVDVVSRLLAAAPKLLKAQREMVDSAPVPHGITTDEQRDRWHEALANAVEAIALVTPPDARGGT